MDRTKKILISLLVLGALAAVGTGTYATFNATTQNAGNTFQTGTILLSQTENVATTCNSWGAVNGGVINAANTGTCAAIFTLGGATTATSDVPGTAGLIFQNAGSINPTTFKVQSAANCASFHPAITNWGTGSLCTGLTAGLQEETLGTALTSALTSGNPYTTLSVGALTLTQSLPKGTMLMLVNAGNTKSQVVVTSGITATGATTINVDSFTANNSYTTSDHIYIPIASGCYLGYTESVPTANTASCVFDSTATTAAVGSGNVSGFDGGITLTGGLAGGSFRYFALGVALENTADNTYQGLCLGTNTTCAGYNLNWTIQ